MLMRLYSTPNVLIQMTHRRRDRVHYCSLLRLGIERAFLSGQLKSWYMYHVGRSRMLLLTGLPLPFQQPIDESERVRSSNSMCDSSST